MLERAAAHQKKKKRGFRLPGQSLARPLPRSEAATPMMRSRKWIDPRGAHPIQVIRMQSRWYCFRLSLLDRSVLVPALDSRDLVASTPFVL